MGDDRLIAAGRNEQQMDRPFDDRSTRNVNEQAVLDHRRVERRERMLVVVRISAQVWLQQIGAFPQRRGQALDRNTARQRS